MRSGAATGPTGTTFHCGPIPCPIPDPTPPTGASGTTLYCAPIPCLSTSTEVPGGPSGPSGPTGLTFLCGPIPCPIPASGATDTSLPCPPIPCAVAGAYPNSGASGPSGPTGTTPPCPPFPCVIGYATTSAVAGATTAEVICPHPPICPLATATHASICGPPCIPANGSAGGTTGTTPLCEPIPNCPPGPGLTVPTARVALYACPQASSPGAPPAKP